MPLTMADVRWRGRLYLIISMGLCVCVGGAPQHHSPGGNHFRITISAEDTGEVSRESLQSHSRTSGSLGGYEGPMQMTKSWMSFGDSDSSLVGRPVSTHYRFERDDNEYDHSLEQHSDEIDDDMVFLKTGFGRRYHPIGAPIDKTAKSFELQPSASTIHAKQMMPRITAPNFISLDSAEDIEEEIEDYVEDVLGSGEYRIAPMTKMYNSETGYARSVISEDAMKSRYNFIDTQGSVNWGFTLEDQFQKQVVHRDGSMDGEYGWDSPGGGKVHVRYTAGKNGFRVVSSHGIYQDFDDDVKYHREQHLNSHRNNGFQVSSEVDDDRKMVVNVPTSPGGSFGVPMPSPGANNPNFQNNPNNNNFGVPMPVPGQEGNLGNTPQNPNFGVSMPTPDVPNPNQGGDNFGIPMPNPGSFGPGNESPTGSFDGLGPDSSNFTPDQGAFNPNFGVPMPSPGLNSNNPQGSDPGFGVPMPTDNTGSFQPNPNNAVPGLGDQLFPQDSPSGGGSPFPGSSGGNGDFDIPPSFGADQPPIPSPGANFPSGGFDINNPTSNSGPEFTVVPEDSPLDNFNPNPFGEVPPIPSNPGFDVNNPISNSGSEFTIVPDDGPLDDFNPNPFDGDAPPLASNVDNLFNNPNSDINPVVSGIDNLFSIGANSDGQNSLLSGPPSNLPPPNQGAFPLVR